MILTLEYISSLIIDLERQYEVMSSFSRRLTDHWKISFGGLLVAASFQDDDLGLSNIAQFDHLYANYIMGYNFFLASRFSLF